MNMPLFPEWDSPITEEINDSTLLNTFQRLSKRITLLNDKIQKQEDANRSSWSTHLLELCFLMDALERIIAADSNNSSLPVLRKQFLNILSEAGVSPMSIHVGDEFSPEWCHVVAVENNPAIQHDTILKIVNIGYKWNGQTLRFARVIVNQNLA